MNRITKKVLASGVWTVGAVVSPLSAVAQAPASPADKVEDIVVTAQRSGIPVWRVAGPRGTIVLVGSLKDVSDDLRWDSDSLVQALQKSDRVMFPAAVRYTASLFAAKSLASKAKKMSILPKGQTLSQHVPAADYGRLVALNGRGLLRNGFEFKHPRAVAQELIETAKGEEGGGGFLSIERVRPGYGDADRYVRAAVKKFKLNMVPIRTAKLKPVLNDYLTLPPAAHLSCLTAAISLAEAGPDSVQARSAHWAQRQVRDVMASPAHQAFEACLPDVMRPRATPEVKGAVRDLLTDPRASLGVFELTELAGPDGVLNDLQSRGFDIRGPRWRAD